MTALGHSGYNCILRPLCLRVSNKEPCDERQGVVASLPPVHWRGAAQPAPDSSPFDYAVLLLYSPTYNHINASQGLKYGT